MTLSSPILVSTLSALLAAVVPAQGPAGHPAQTLTQGLPVQGSVPGTERWNVTFRTRGFDLDELRSALENDAPADVVAAIVRDLELRAKADQEPFRAAIQALGGKVLRQFWLINAASVEIDPRHLPALREMANVLFVDPDVEVLPVHNRAVPFLTIKTSAAAGNHDSDYVHGTLGHRGTGYAIAIVDTGQDSSMAGSGKPHQIYYRNGDKTDHTGSGIDGSLLLANKQIGSVTADDTNGHGTGVCGIAAGSPWKHAGAGTGHASDAGKVGYSICESAGGCASTLATQAAAWQAVVTDKNLYGIVACNMSYASSNNPMDVSQQAIDAAALNADIVCVTAAGNSGPGGTPTSSCTANGLAVAAVAPTAKTVAAFSTRGPMAGDLTRTFPDLSACGVGTVMPAIDNETTTYVNSGTSMASPQVAGAAVLIKSARPSATSREIKAALLCYAEDITAQNAGLTVNDFGQGFLRDDLACTNAAVSNKIFSDSISSATAPKTYSLAVKKDEQVSIALTWYRHVLTSSAWSDLNLKVKNNGATVASSTSPRNLYEVVRFKAPITGNLLVEVSAARLEVATVPFALASTHPFWGYGALDASVGIDASARTTIFSFSVVGSPGAACVVLASPKVTAGIETPYGTLYLDPAYTPTIAVFGLSGAGYGTKNLSVPSNSIPALSLAVQAIVIGGPTGYSLTNFALIGHYADARGQIVGASYDQKTDRPKVLGKWLQEGDTMGLWLANPGAPRRSLGTFKTPPPPTMFGWGMTVPVGFHPTGTIELLVNGVTRLLEMK